ncbi:hypothetical protein BDR04DRAFT_1126852 [Suillus decipiens]|nr:hypothetical protein BDR04DRAFT_1126852 [Suillus decipiens]
MTPFVQPWNTGIIHCFKAIYYCNFCAHAIDLDDAGEQDIYRLNILKGMTMAKQACDPTVSLNLRSHINPATWNIVHKFATTEMSLPMVENDLKAHLHEHYVDSDWRPALKAISDAKGDTNIALNTINALAEAASHHTADQLSSIEVDLIQSVNDFKAHNCIFGQLPTLEELLDPAEEREIGDCPIFEEKGYTSDDLEVIA